VNKDVASPAIIGWVADISDFQPTRYLCVAGKR
jgi:hypothetical protein